MLFNFDIKIDDSKFPYQVGQELIDSMTAVIKWYGLDVDVINTKRIRLKSLDDQVKVNRAFKKHFESCRMSPILSKKYPNDFVWNQVTVTFYGHVSDEKITTFLESLGIKQMYIRDRQIEPTHPVEVSVQFDDVIQPSFYQKLEKIYANELVFSIRTSTEGGNPPYD